MGEVDLENHFQICQLLAEIEGYDELKEKDVGFVAKKANGAPTLFNPIEDDGLCFQLMIKHKVELNFSHGVFTRASVPEFKSNDEDACLSCVDYYSDGCSHNKAICVAIIEANMNKQ